MKASPLPVPRPCMTGIVCFLGVLRGYSALFPDPSDRALGPDSNLQYAGDPQLLSQLHHLLHLRGQV